MDTDRTAARWHCPLALFFFATLTAACQSPTSPSDAHAAADGSADVATEFDTGAAPDAREAGTPDDATTTTDVPTTVDAAADGGTRDAANDTGGASSCAAMTPCDPIAQTGCPAGQACYPTWSSSHPPTYTGVQCLPAGTRSGSDECDSETMLCLPGYACALGLACEKICDPAHGSSHSTDCAGESGDTCSGLASSPTCHGYCGTEFGG